MSLLDVLTFFVEQTPPLLPAPLLDASLTFTPPLEVIYLRQRIVGLAALAACSLSSLGLAGSSARLQVRIPTAMVPGGVEEPPTSSDTSCTEAVSTSNLQDQDQNQPSAEQKQVPCSNKVDGYYMETKGPIPSPEAQKEEQKWEPQQQQDQQQQQVTAEERKKDTVHDQPPMEISPPASPARKSAPQLPPTPPPSLVITPASVRAAVTAILNSNFDVASRKAIFTTIKYLDNLIKFPNSDDKSVDDAGLLKYRSINLGNAIVREQILSCSKGIELLLALGFTVVEAAKNLPPAFDFLGTQSLPTPSSASEKLVFGFSRVQQDWQLNPQTLRGYTLNSVTEYSNQDTATGGVVLVSTLLDAREVLCDALNELDHSSSSQTTDGSTVAAPVSVVSLLQSIARRQAPAAERISATSAPPVVEFDPYKPFIMRAGADKVCSVFF